MVWCLKNSTHVTSIIKNKDVFQNMMADYFLAWTQVLPFSKGSVPRSLNVEFHFDLHNSPVTEGLLWPTEKETESMRLSDLPSCHGVSLFWGWDSILALLAIYSSALSSVQSHLPAKAKKPNYSLGCSMPDNSWSQLSSVCTDVGILGYRLW